MTDAPRKRGRPRAYDPDQALERARSVFWDAGYASSSLDELGAAMSMNRPSLYGAFGDKEALYLRTLEGYRQESLALLRTKLDPARPLRECLRAVYAAALDIYLGGDAPRGCFLIGTATVEAVMHPAVRRDPPGQPWGFRSGHCGALPPRHRPGRARAGCRRIDPVRACLRRHALPGGSRPRG